ncbi:hypothetical protein [Paludisphaera rhizosphaerae]|uniref:hypothetical protein n=1 Tax=Paludisphaera rhizosphaerae TaxID=2711216 RepID=UPI001F0FDB60|nr:hypothetical protein [Paludisphaera rhizosphaerae]
MGLRDWLRLARAVPSAWDLRKILISAVGLIALGLGASALDRLAPGAAPLPIWGDWGGHIGVPLRGPSDLSDVALRAAMMMAEPVHLLVGPLVHLFARTASIVPTLLQLVWTLAVMGVVGGALAHMELAEAATGERPGVAASLAFAFRRAPSVIAAPLHPLLIVLMLGLMSAVLGKATALAALVLGLFSAVLLLEMVASWPLIHAAVAAESETAVEAIGRCYGYVNHRPLTLATALAVGWALGSVGLAAFELFLRSAFSLGEWGVGIGLSNPGATGMRWESGPSPWVALMKLTWEAWAFAFFWASAARTYLLLRQDLDDIPAWGSAAARR